MQNILEVKNLTLGFNLKNGVFNALHGVDFELKEKETLAIVGESGCGKTLTAMSVLRLIPNTATIQEGKIFYKGENLLAFDENKMQKIRGKHIALIPQDPMTSLNPLYTIENQMLEVIELHQGLKDKEATEMAIEALEKVKIPNPKERLKSYPHEFSGGMRQRVIIAMALACNADIIIADEPTTALDVTVQAQIMELLKEIKEKYGTSIILISHDLGLVAENSDKIAVMYAGSIVEYSDSKELFKNPKHPYTKALLKALPDINTNKLETMDGQPPSIQDKITGCAFSPRCSSVMDICKVQNPPVKDIEGKSKVKCFLFN